MELFCSSFVSHVKWVPHRWVVVFCAICMLARGPATTCATAAAAAAAAAANEHRSRAALQIAGVCQKLCLVWVKIFARYLSRC